MSSSEKKRLEALQSYDVLDTAAQEPFDRVVRLAASLFDVPIALISLIDAKRQWFKARIGVDACETPREWAFCSHAIELDPHAVMVVEDAAFDPRFRDNPLVTSDLNIRFYAGAVLTDADGYNLGTLCIIDKKPRSRPSDAALAQLKMLASMAADQLALRRAHALIDRKIALLDMAEQMSGVGHWQYDVDTKTPAWSDEVYRIFGVNRATFDPSFDRAVAFYPPETRDAAYARFQHALDTGEGYHVRQKLIRRDGTVRDILSQAKCEIGANGKTKTMFGVFQDITAHTQAVTRAQAAAKAKAEFLANMSHEIRTPLTSVIGFADLLYEHGNLSEPALGYASRVRNGGKSLLGLISNVLDYSKLEDGQIEIDPTPTQVALLAEETIELLAVQARNKGLRLNLDCPDVIRSISLMVDPHRLRQVLLNLLGNAIKFTETGSVRLEMRCHGHEISADGNRLRCRVIDSGCGIAQADQEKLFQHFSQVDGSTSRRHGGTGLGLAICKGFVEAMGGEIGVASAEGKGAIFWFEIPAPLASTAPVFAVSAAGGIATGQKRVLVVDDNESNRLLVTAALKPLQLSIETAHSGEQAIALAAASPFDVILMDIRMPGMGGTAAMRAIRAVTQGHCPIIAFTAEGDRGQLDALIRQGFDGTLSKPLDIAGLRACVMGAFGGNLKHLEQVHVA